MLDFDFSEEDLIIISPPNFLYDVWRRNVLYPINSPNFIAWFPLFFEVLFNMCIAIASQPGCEVINFEINPLFIICMTNKSWQSVKYLENEKSFWGEIKSIFHHFEKVFSYHNFSQTWECAFKVTWFFDYIVFWDHFLVGAETIKSPQLRSLWPPNLTQWGHTMKSSQS